MALSRFTVKQFTSSDSDFSDGVMDYQSKGVTSYRCADKEDGIREISADVLDTHYESYSVKVGLMEDWPVYFQCGCTRNRQEKGLCRHGVALLLRYCDEQLSDRNLFAASRLMPDEKEKAGPRRKPEETRTTNYHALRMMERYQKEEDGQTLADSIQTAEKLNIRIGIAEDIYHKFNIYMTLGSRRMYIVKSIPNFCLNMQESRTESYGKMLEVVHHMDSFLPEAQPFVKFIMDKYQDYMGYRGQNNNFYSGYSSESRYLPLSRSAMEQLMNLYLSSGQPVLFRKQGETEQDYPLTDGNPEITVSVRGSSSGFTFSTSYIQILYGETRCCILMGKHFYFCTEEFSRKATDFLTTINQADGFLYIAHKDMPSFCNLVLPAVRDILNFTGDTERMEMFFPDPLEVELFLDAPSRSQITAKVVYRYGEEEFNPYAEKQPDIIKGKRNLRSEFKMKILTQKQFPYIEADRSHLYLEGDDKDIYQFISEGLPTLMQAATVHVTDRFSNIGMLPPPKVSVGVRMDSSLLEMDIDTGEFPLEELIEVLKAYRMGQKYYRLTDGRFMQLEDNAIGGLSQLVDGLDLTKEQLREHAIHIPKYRALYLDRVLSGQEDIILNRDRYYRNLVREMKYVEDSEFEIPGSLGNILRNYQKAGFRWLCTMEAYHFGGILADDMGLGKTLQVIALLLSYREGHEDRLPSLVVCPTSLVYNWESEIRRFAPSLRVLTVTGDTAQRRETISYIDQYDVAITSYDLLKRDVPLYEGISFQYHIIDEAQYIKNHTTQNAKSVKAIKSQQRFALTGTPVENCLSELWSIFDFLMPGFLYHYNHFREKFETPIVKNKDANVLEQLSKMVLPFVLRRMKKDVLKELPSKTETILYATLSGEQRKVYLAYAAQARQQVQEDMDSPNAGNRIIFLSMLTRLRQLCCDPSLCLENYSGNGAKEDVCIELIRSAKEGGHKVLLFSQFTSMLSILEKRLEKEQIRYFTLKGSTSQENRAKMVNQFNRDDTDVFLISLKAGGTGLNLTAADVVIHYDPWWNISAQNQATDRAYRIGQKNSVQVYKIIAKDTIEEKICKMQEAKQELAESIIQAADGEGAITRMSSEQLMEILN